MKNDALNNKIKIEVLRWLRGDVTIPEVDRELKIFLTRLFDADAEEVVTMRDSVRWINED